jgi:putative polyketide hydroxylase
MAEFSTQVIVVGAGPVGLAAALLFERDGVDAIVLERAVERARHPKARGLRLRASELLSAWGFDDSLRARAMKDEAHRFIYCETLAGEEIARTVPAASATESWSSMPQYRVAQDKLEDVLETELRVRANRVQLRRGVTVTAVRELEGGVAVDTTRSDGVAETLTARYLVAADGVASAVRGMLGLRLGARRPTPYWHSFYWSGDLSAYTADRPAIAYYTRTGGDAMIGIAPAGDPDRWVTLVQNPPSGERPDPIDDEHAIDVIRRAVGVDGLPVEMISNTTFRIGSDVLDTYRIRRVFFAGDAAHALPPTGGFGINTGFADIHNLAWKLARVLDGTAPESLLSTYDSERRPVAVSNVAWSSSNNGRLVAMRKALTADDRAEIVRLVAEQANHVDPLVQDIGFSYVELEPNAAPAYERLTLGARAPHALVVLDGRVVSTLDIFEGRMTLVAHPGSPWLSAEQTVITDLRQLVLDTGTDGRLIERFPLGSFGAAVVRPDGHVGWLGTHAPTEGELTRVLQEMLATGFSRS